MLTAEERAFIEEYERTHAELRELTQAELAHVRKELAAMDVTVASLRAENERGRKERDGLRDELDEANLDRRPVKLTDEELSDARRRAAAWLLRDDNTFATRETAINEELLALDVVDAVDEIRARRAADLTPEERAALKALVLYVDPVPTRAPRCADLVLALAVLDRLLAAQEKP